MSYLEFNNFVKNNGIPRTDATDGEIALTKSDALKALELLAGTNITVLGGDVYELESDGYFRPTYDNWHFNKDDSSSLDPSKKSRKEALLYLKNYKEATNLNIRYVLVVDA